MTQTARIEPTASDVGGPFWEASRDRRLELPWCGSCERPHWYPREVCPHCHSTDVSWRPASGRGDVYAVSVQHRAFWPGLADRVPYAVVLVDLEEGVRLMSNLVGCEVEAATPGMAVRVTWEELSDGRHLPLFEPA